MLCGTLHRQLGHGRVPSSAPTRCPKSCLVLRNRSCCVYTLRSLLRLPFNIQFRDPHALNTETCGLQRSGPSIDIQWETYIYEYGAQTPIGTTRYPHLILLGAQSCNGKDNSICLGELTTIVTAMRCRAYQPAIFDENAILVGDVEQSVDGNPMPDDERELVFKNEKRFPVCYIFLMLIPYVYFYKLTNRPAGLGHHGFPCRPPALQVHLRLYGWFKALH